jgi:hypothetical protein
MNAIFSMSFFCVRSPGKVFGFDPAAFDPAAFDSALRFRRSRDQPWIAGRILQPRARDPINELGPIMPGGHDNLYRLIRTFVVIEFVQLLSQPKNFHPNDGVRGLIEGLGPAKDIGRDGILLDGIGVALKVSFANMFQQVG